MKRHIQLAIISCACLALLGCMTVQPLTAERAQLSQSLHAGDRVEVVTTSGQRLNFEVEGIDANGLHGAGQHIAYGDIQSISREKVSVGKTSAIALAIAAAAALLGGGGGSSSY